MISQRGNAQAEEKQRENHLILPYKNIPEGPQERNFCGKASDSDKKNKGKD